MTNTQEHKTMYKITMNETRQAKTGNKWVDQVTSREQLSEEQYSNYTCKDTLQWFRRLGGTETATKSYTCRGYCVTKLISTSPDKLERSIRTFTFKFIAE